MADSEQVSRREFVKMAGVAIGGIAVGAVGGYSLMPPKEKEIEVPVAVEGPMEVPEHPWTYSKLSVEAVKQRAYDAYFQGGCCYAVFEGIVGELRDTVGFPYNAIPTKMATFGSGGIKGWGSTCGTLMGGGMAVTLMTSGSTLNDMMGWYSETALPIFVPATAAKVEGDIPKSVSDSPLCHASVTNWCNTAGVSSGDPARAERCGRLCADVAGKIVEMLNAETDGTFTAVYSDPENVIECAGCHSSSGMVANVNSHMDCESCHESPHETG